MNSPSSNRKANKAGHSSNATCKAVDKQQQDKNGDLSVVWSELSWLGGDSRQL